MRPYNGFGPLLEQHDGLAYTQPEEPRGPSARRSPAHIVKRDGAFKRGGYDGYYKALCGRVLRPRKTIEYACTDLCAGCKTHLVRIIEERGDS